MIKNNKNGALLAPSQSVQDTDAMAGQKNVSVNIHITEIDEDSIMVVGSADELDLFYQYFNHLINKRNE